MWEGINNIFNIKINKMKSTNQLLSEANSIISEVRIMRQIEKDYLKSYMENDKVRIQILKTKLKLQQQKVDQMINEYR